MSDIEELTPEQLLEEAKALQSSGEHAEALGRLARVVELGGDWESAFRFANSLAIEGQVDRAYHIYRDVLASPEWNPAQVQGELAGQLAEALRHVSFETTVDADDPKSSYLQAKISQLFEQPDVVRHALVKTINRDPDYEDALDWLMRFYQTPADFEEALKLLEPLLLSNAQSAPLNYWVGELNFQTQRTAVAIRILSAAAKLDHNRWEAQARLGQIYSSQHRFEEADAAFEAALRHQPDNLTLVMGSLEAAKRLYQFDRALQLLEKATQLAPDDTQVQIEFAQLSFQMGALDKAVPGLELALAANPDDPHMCANLAKAYQATGQHEKAVPLLQKGLLSQPDAEVAFLLARTLAELKRKPEALEALRKAVELAPDRAHYQAMWGKELLAMGQQEEALKALAAAAELEPSNAMAQLTVAGLYKKSGQAKAALEAYLRASSLEPERVDVHLQVGVLGLSCDRLDEASHAFKEVLRLSSTPHPMALAGVAQIYQRRGMSDVAVDFYRQALNANPGLAAAAQAVSIIFAKDKDIDGLLSFLRDLIGPLRAQPEQAQALVGNFKSYLESKGLLGFCAEIANLFAELCPSPEADAERARLFFARADQLQAKGDPLRAYQILARLHQLQPELPDLAARVEALRTALGPAAEVRVEAQPAKVAEPAPSSVESDLLDSLFAPAAQPPSAEVTSGAPEVVESLPAVVAPPPPSDAIDTVTIPTEVQAVLVDTDARPEPEAAQPTQPALDQSSPPTEQPPSSAVAEAEVPLEMAAPAGVAPGLSDSIAEPEQGSISAEVAPSAEPIATPRLDSDGGPVGQSEPPAIEQEVEAAGEPVPEETSPPQEPDLAPASQLADELGTAVESQPAPALAENPPAVEIADAYEPPGQPMEPTHPPETAEFLPEQPALIVVGEVQEPIATQPEPAEVEPIPAPVVQQADLVEAQPPSPEPVELEQPMQSFAPAISTEQGPELGGPEEPPSPLADPVPPADALEKAEADAIPEATVEPEIILAESPHPVEVSESAFTSAEPKETQPPEPSPSAVLEATVPDSPAPAMVTEESPQAVEVLTPPVQPVEIVEAQPPTAVPVAVVAPPSGAPEEASPLPTELPDPTSETPQDPVDVGSEEPSRQTPQENESSAPPLEEEPLAPVSGAPAWEASVDTEPVATPVSSFVRNRLFELHVHSQRPTQQHVWEKSLGEYLLASASSRGVKQPRELDDEGRDELCEIYLEMAKVLKDAGWLEQSSAVLSTALLYNPTHERVLDELEETMLEWVDFLEVEDCYQQAVMLLEGQWERRPSDRLKSRARQVFTTWSAALRQDSDQYGAEALEAHGALRMRYWEQLRTAWSTRVEQPRSPDWE